jgi:type I restriction enzyme, S subunit
MVPKGWKIKKLEELCCPDAPITYGVLKPGEFYLGGIPLLQIKDLRDGDVNTHDIHLISPKLDEEYKRSRILRNDILISLVGTIGRIAKYQSDEDANIHRNIGRIRSDHHEYLYHFLMSSYAQNEIGSSSSGSSQSALNLSSLRDMKIPVPPRPEQKKIAQILSVWDKAITTTEHLLANSQQQKKALMQKLLTGKVRFSEFDGKWKAQLLGDWIVEYKEKSSAHGQHILLTSSRNGLILQSDYYGENRITERDNVGFNVIPPEYVTYRSRSDDGMFTFNINKLGITGLISVYYPVFKFGNGVTEYFVNLLKLNESIFESYSVGTSQKVLSINALKSIKLKITNNIEEQKKISAVLSSADKEIDLIQHKLTCLKNEKKALMQQLLTGKRRVKIEPLEKAKC